MSELAGPDLPGISGGSSDSSFIPPTSPKANPIKYLSDSRYESTLEYLWVVTLHHPSDRLGV